MSDIIGHIINVFLGFIAIMNPVANTAVFIGLTNGESSSEKRKIAFRSLYVAFCIVTVFALLGNVIFHLFGITLPALRVTGGILVFLIGYNMLNGERSKMHKPRGDDAVGEEPDVAISPLSVPILAGPGTIATAINFSSSGGWSSTVITILMFALLCVVTFYCFIAGPKLVNYLGKGCMGIITRLMGLILSVIGVQMLMEGVAGAVNHWQQLSQ